MAFRKASFALLAILLVVPAQAHAAGGVGSSTAAGAARALALREGLPSPDLRIRSDRSRPEAAAEPFREIIRRHLTSQDAALDPRTYLAVVADAMEASGLAVASSTAADASSAAFRFARGAGDLTGDGRDDVLELHTPLDGGGRSHRTWSLIARTGATGARAWARGLLADDLLVAPVGDLTGDGRADLLILRLFASETQRVDDCAYDIGVCASAHWSSFRTVIEVRSGDGGRLLWSRGYDGRAFSSGASAFMDLPSAFAFAIADPAVATNAFVFPSLGGDHDGDGLRDVVINAIDFAEVFGVANAFGEAAGGLLFGDQIITATRAVVARGSDGTSLYARDVPLHPGVGLLWTAGHAVGDTTIDLVWEHTIYGGPAALCSFSALAEECVSAAAVDITAEMIDGATLQTTWRAKHAAAGADGFYLPLDADADGDDAADLIFLEFGSEESSTIMISGATGEALWRTSGFVLGALGTDAQTGTPLVLAFEDMFDFENVTFDLLRIDGRTGEEVGRAEHRYPITGDWWELFVLIELWNLPDSDADGVGDPFVQVSVYAGPSVTVDTVLESGLTMTPLYARHVDRELFAVPIADLDGDGVVDLFDLDVTVHRTSLALGTAGTSMPSGSSLWSRTLRFYPGVFGFFEPGGLLDADAGTDLLLSVIQDTPTATESAIRAIRGTNGNTLWQRGTLSQPPSPGTASISGTITGDGSAFFGACVSIFDVDGRYWGTEVATPDGSYTIAELDPGSYKLEFASCFFDPFASEWYDDKPDFDAADVVAVADGEAVTGIDADLAPAIWE